MTRSISIHAQSSMMMEAGEDKKQENEGGIDILLVMVVKTRLACR